MKITLWLILIMFIHTYVVGRKIAVRKSKAQHYIDERTFDVKQFNCSKVNGHVIIKLEDSTEVFQFETNDVISEDIKMPDRLTVYKKTFYKKTGFLKAEGMKFLGCNVGIGKVYDEQGSILQIFDWDHPFLFTVSDLARKMKDLGIDIRKANAGISIHRSERPSPIYQVACSINGNPWMSKIFVVDGINGKIIDDTVVIHKCY